MRLDYSEQNKASLAIVDEWQDWKYGMSSNENIMSYQINVMTKLSFLYNKVDLNEFYDIETLDIPSFISLNFSVIKGWFHYKSRAFAVPNKSFEKFLKKMKKRYQRKIALKKNPINLRHREITGKFKF
jgi:hypothetical protein